MHTCIYIPHEVYTYMYADTSELCTGSQENVASKYETQNYMLSVTLAHIHLRC